MIIKKLLSTALFLIIIKVVDANIYEKPNVAANQPRSSVYVKKKRDIYLKNHVNHSLIL